MIRGHGFASTQVDALGMRFVSQSAIEIAPGGLKPDDTRSQICVHVGGRPAERPGGAISIAYKKENSQCDVTN
jgi:hypothetical protein